MRCNQIGRERIHGKCTCPALYIRLKKYKLFASKYKELMEIWEKAKAFLKLPCGSLNKAPCLLLHNEVEKPEMHLYNVAKEMKFLERQGSQSRSVTLDSFTLQQWLSRGLRRHFFQQDINMKRLFLKVWQTRCLDGSSYPKQLKSLDKILLKIKCKHELGRKQRMQSPKPK